MPVLAALPAEHANGRRGAFAPADGVRRLLVDETVTAMQRGCCGAVKRSRSARLRECLSVAIGMPKAVVSLFPSMRIHHAADRDEPDGRGQGKGPGDTRCETSVLFYCTLFFSSLLISFLLSSVICPSSSLFSSIPHPPLPTHAPIPSPMDEPAHGTLAESGEGLVSRWRGPLGILRPGWMAVCRGHD